MGRSHNWMLIGSRDRVGRDRGRRACSGWQPSGGPPTALRGHGGGDPQPLCPQGPRYSPLPARPLRGAGFAWREERRVCPATAGPLLRPGIRGRNSSSMRAVKQGTETLRTCDPRACACATRRPRETAAWPGTGGGGGVPPGSSGRAARASGPSPARASRMVSTPVAARIVCAPRKTRAFSLVPQHFPGRRPPKHESLPGAKFERRWAGEPSAPPFSQPASDHAVGHPGCPPHGRASHRGHLSVPAGLAPGAVGGPREEPRGRHVFTLRFACTFIVHFP